MLGSAIVRNPTMAQFLYWLDRGSLATLLQHSWIWLATISLLGAANVFGIAAILRHYDGRRGV